MESDPVREITDAKVPSNARQLLLLQRWNWELNAMHITQPTPRIGARVKLASHFGTNTATVSEL